MEINKEFLLHLLSTVNQSLLLWGDAFLFFNTFLYARDFITWFNINFNLQQSIRMYIHFFLNARVLLFQSESRLKLITRPFFSQTLSHLDFNEHLYFSINKVTKNLPTLLM